MKIPSTIIASIAAILTMSTVVSAEGTQWFARPYAELINVKTDGYDKQAGFGVAGGITFGQNNAQEVSLDISRAQWNSSGGYAGINVNITETYIPVLLSYRYSVPLWGDNLSFYAGPAIGFSNYRLDATGSTSTISIGDHGTGWGFTASATAGVVYKLDDRVSLDVGYRYLHIKAANVTLWGSKLSPPNFNAHCLSVGIAFKL